MSREPKLPSLARLLLWLSPVPRDERGAVRGDLHELFLRRRAGHGAVHAHWRLYHDIASLWRLPLLSDARIDLKHAARLFARQPAILLLTVAGLSLGLGIATSAFSIVNAAALRGDGLVDSDRAPGVLKTIGQSTMTEWRYDEFRHLREGAARVQVEAVLREAVEVRTTATEGDLPSVPLAFVSGGFFSATGGRMMAGRPLAPSDETTAVQAGPVPVVVGFGFWTARLHSDPQAVGRTIRVGRADATVVGVAERGFSVPNSIALWLPLTAYGDIYNAPAMRVPKTGLQVFGRLQPGVSLAEAEAQLSGVAAALPRDPKIADSPVGTRLDPHAGLGRGSAAQTMAIVAFVVVVIGLVLLLACANVATVLVSTAITREREMGVRAALGASRRRIVRQLVTESLALGSISAMAGLLFAYWAMPVIARMIEAPAGVDLAPDLTVYAFLGIATVVTGVGAGLAPARHGRGVDLITPLKGETRQNRVPPRRLRSLLVMTQAAVSVLLIVTAAFFVRASVEAATVDVGFDPDRLYAVSARFGYGDESGARERAFWSRARAEVGGVPGIAAATLSEVTPFDGLTKSSTTREVPARRVYIHETGAEYFDTLGLRLLAGRPYTRDEVAAGSAVAVVSESLARAYWPGQSPLGQLLPETIPVYAARPVVIGVLSDAITARLHERSTLAFYQPLAPKNEMFAQLIVRVAPGATGVMDQLSRSLRAIDPQADVRVESVEALLKQEASRPRTLATLTGFVGAVAIVLCVIGLYGLTASVVGQRTREMGVRVALGASRWDLLRLLMWDSLRPVVLGLAAGSGIGLLVSRLAASMTFFGVSPQDPLAFGGAVAILFAAAMVAVLLPTRRAAGVDAAVVLKGS